MLNKMTSSKTLPLPTFKVGGVLSVAAATLFLSLLAQVAIPLPFTPVPLTGQTFGVFLAALLLGRKRVVAAVTVYLCLSGSSGKSRDARSSSNSRCPSGTMMPPPSPDEGMTMVIPIACRRLGGDRHSTPVLKTPALECKRA